MKAIFLSALVLTSVAAHAEVSYPFRRDYNMATMASQYVYDDGDCRIELDSYDEDNKRSRAISISRHCPLGFAYQVGIIAILLSQVKNDGRLEWVNTFVWGLKHPEVQERLALAALASPKWRALTDNGKRSHNPEVGHPNYVTADILNEALVFRELVVVFEAIGFRLQVEVVDKAYVRDIGTAGKPEGADSDKSFYVPFRGAVYFRLEPL